MLRELRRFNVADDDGRVYTVAEVVSYVVVGDLCVTDGVPTLLSSAGYEAEATETPGEYRIPRIGLRLREVVDQQSA